MSEVSSDYGKVQEPITSQVTGANAQRDRWVSGYVNNSDGGSAGEQAKFGVAQNYTVPRSKAFQFCIDPTSDAADSRIRTQMNSVSATLSNAFFQSGWNIYLDPAGTSCAGVNNKVRIVKAGSSDILPVTDIRHYATWNCLVESTPLTNGTPTEIRQAFNLNCPAF